MSPEIKLSDSKMAMWRSLIAFAYIDGNLPEKEKAVLTNFIEANHINAEQHAQLEADIKNGVALKDVYPGITDVRDRANLLNMGRVLFYADGDFSAAEQRVYDEIHHDQEVAVDFHKAEEMADKLAEDYQFQELKEELDEEAKESRLERLFRYIADIPNLFTGNQRN